MKMLNQCTTVHKATETLTACFGHLHIKDLGFEFQPDNLIFISFLSLLVIRE